MSEEGGCKCSCESRIESLEETVRLLNLQVKNLERGMAAVGDMKQQVAALQATMDRALGHALLAERNGPSQPLACSRGDATATATQPTPPSTPGSSADVRSPARAAASDCRPTAPPLAPPSYEDVIAESLLMPDEGPYSNIARNGSPTALEEAAMKGQTSTVEMILSSSAPFDRDQINRALLVTRNSVILKMLLDAGANPNASDSNKCSALHWSSQKGSETIVEALLRAGATVEAQDKWGNTPLHVAAQCNSEQIVRILLSAGASPSVKNSEGWKPCDLATSPDLKSLLSESSSYRILSRSRNPTALEEAAEKGYTSSVETLLRCGASSDTEQINSALVSAGSLVIVNMLLDAGADPNACDSNKCSALHWAAQKGLEASVTALLKAGATIEARDKWGNTPLHVAAQCDREDVVRVLLSLGASAHVRNVEGWKPYDLTSSSTLKSLLN